MGEIEVLEIDDRFGESVEQETDYLPPIPDAELSRVPRAEAHTPRERIEALLAGIPGQKFRILHAVELCEGPRSCEEVAAALDERFAGDVSVYDSAQIVRLLERAGALELCEVDGTGGVGTDARDESPVLIPTFTSDFDETTVDYRVVAPAPERLYRATPEGLEAVAAHTGERPIFALLAEEPQYLPLYRRILELASAEGGCMTKGLDAAIDSDPLCESPRRFCGYFLGRLEGAGAICWRGSWTLTEQGRAVLAAEFAD